MKPTSSLRLLATLPGHSRSTAQPAASTALGSVSPLPTAPGNDDSPGLDTLGKVLWTSDDTILAGYRMAHHHVRSVASTQTDDTPEVLRNITQVLLRSYQTAVEMLEHHDTTWA
jgi:hypothetical protein